MKRDIFRQTIVSKFQFLELDYGFSVLRTPMIAFEPDAEAVVYERSKTQVIVSCSIQDGWGLEVLFENPTFGEFSFHTYLNLVDIQTARMIGYSMAATDDELFELVEIYSQALKKLGAGLLSEDEREWDRLRRAEELGEGLSEIDNSQERFCDAILIHLGSSDRSETR